MSGKTEPTTAAKKGRNSRNEKEKSLNKNKRKEKTTPVNMPDNIWLLKFIEILRAKII